MISTPLKTLVTDGLSKEGIEQIKKNAQIDLEYHEALPLAELKQKMGDIDVLVVRSRTQVDRALLEGASRLKLVLRAGIGLDNVDVEAAKNKKIAVMNAPSGNIVTTAEHTIAMLFAVSRKIPQAHLKLSQGIWDKKKFQGYEIRGKTLGVLGLGNIGRVVADRAHAMQMRVIGFDPSSVVTPNYIERVNFEMCLSQADYLTLHLPLLPQTRNLLSRENLLKMKKGAFLINCARGGIVQEADLVSLLEAGHLRGAALDVFEEEPLSPTSPLLGRDDVVLTPHLGASTYEAQVLVGLEVAEQLELLTQKGIYKNAVYVP